MATIKELSSGNFQVCVRNSLLPKPYWGTFDTFEQASAYGRQLEALLAQGIVPKSLLERDSNSRDIWTVSRCIAEYVRHNDVPLSEVKLLDTVRPSLGDIRLNMLNYDWAEGWIRSLKREGNLAPSTIRHRHGALARCFDWVLRKHADKMAQNPLRLLKRGFATYTDEDRRYLESIGKSGKNNVERDRRLEEGEEARILGTLGQKDDERVFFLLALESGMRMRECYTLYASQVSLLKKTIHLDRSKNGDNRQVPMNTNLIRILDDYLLRNRAAIRARGGRLFPYWSGDMNEAVLDATTADLSYQFREIFAAAGVDGLHFHDLRHEATCRLYEKTTLSDVLISKITGHKDIRMLKRYASLRGSDLASRLW
jgi:integrase